jgi:hypothetical protein
MQPKLQIMHKQQRILPGINLKPVNIMCMTECVNACLLGMFTKSDSEEALRITDIVVSTILQASYGALGLDHLHCVRARHTCSSTLG